MTDLRPTEPRPDRDALLARDGHLAVLRPAQAVKGLVPSAPPPPDAQDLFLLIDDEGQIFAFNGHVDLGTGIRTALAQIVAEELDVPLAAAIDDRLGIDVFFRAIGHGGGDHPLVERRECLFAPQPGIARIDLRLRPTIYRHVICLYPDAVQRAAILQ